MWRAQTLAMDDAQATTALGKVLVKEGGQYLAGIITVQSVQIDFILNHPATAAQVTQYGAGQSAAQVMRFVATLQPVLQADLTMQTLMQSRPFVGQVLQWPWWRRLLLAVDAARFGQWPGASHCRPKGSQIVRVDHA